MMQFLTAVLKFQWSLYLTMNAVDEIYVEHSE